MGAGGQRSEPRTEVVPKRVPHSKPPFTVSQLKKAIPPHCFKRSVLRSVSYLIYDLAIAYLFYYVANAYIPLLPQPLTYAAWPIYWFCQGSILTAVWVIGHECGHHAFSDYQWLDDAVGFVLHSALLVPYFSWKHSHRRHHSNTGSLENDEVYVPKQKASLHWTRPLFNNPPGRILSTLFMLVFGFPLYLMFNLSGRAYERFTCHFDPYSPLYTDRERVEIYLSDAGFVAVLYGLYRLSASQGLAWVLSIYGVPVLVVNGFFISITYLHHTHRALPRYDSTEWEWLRGALSTIDRDYGFLNKVFHHVTDTHITHHLFSSIPHYHAMEATKALKQVLGEYYQIDRTPILKAMWREGIECVYVQPDDGDDQSKGVFWYRNKM